MKPSDISTVADFISDELENRELSFSRAGIKSAVDALAAFERILVELAHLQSSVSCSASASVNSNRETGETDW